MEPFITAVAGDSAAGPALIALLLLIGLLIQKEIAGGLATVRARRLNRALNIAVVPLLIVCAGIVLLRIADALW
jgi:hypothetical protein